MVWIRFIGLLLRYGSLLIKPYDFQARRQNGLKALSSDLGPIKKQGYPTSKMAAAIFNLRSFLSELKRLPFLSPKIYHLKKDHYYLRIPKCGSTTILSALIQRHDPNLNVSIMTDDQVDVLSEEILSGLNNTQLSKNSVLHVIIRNPIDRLISTYRQYFLESTEFQFSNYLLGVLKPDDSFDRLVGKLRCIPPQLLDQNFRPQTNFIGQNKVRVHKLENGLEEILSILTDESRISDKKRNQTSSNFDSRDVGPETIRVIGKIYGKDIVTFLKA